MKNYAKLNVGDINMGGTAGTALEVRFEWADKDDVPALPGVVSLWLGGSRTATDDLTDATEVLGVVDGTDTVHAVLVPPIGEHRLRLTVDGNLAAVGFFDSSARGIPSPSLVVPARVLSGAVFRVQIARGIPGLDGDPGPPGVIDATGIATYDAPSQTINVPMPSAADIGAATAAQGDLAGTAIQPADLAGLGTAAGADVEDFDAAGTAVEVVETASMPTSLGLQPPGLDGWFEALTTGPSDAVVLGDSLASLGTTWPSLAEQALLPTWGTRPFAGGWRYGAASLAASLVGTGTAVAAGAGSQSVSMAAGQGRTAQGMCDRLSVIWHRQPGGGTLTIRDGGSTGASMGTIDTVGADEWSHLTEIDFPTYADRTVWIGVESGAAATVEAVHLSAGDGPRFWHCAQAGQSLGAFLDDPSRGFDLISTLQPDLVVIAAGHNDPVAAYPQRLNDTIAEIRSRAPDADIVVWLPWRTVAAGVTKLAGMRDAALASGLPIIDASMIGSAAGNPTLSSDQLHPTPVATRRMADQVITALSGDPFSAASIAATRPRSTQTWDTGLGMIEHIAFGGHPMLAIRGTGQAQPQVRAVLGELAALLGLPGATIQLGNGTTDPDLNLSRSAAAGLTINNGDGTIEVARLRLKELTAVPAGPNKVGDQVNVNGTVQTCTTAGSPGTWAPVGTQT